MNKRTIFRVILTGFVLFFFASSVFAEAPVTEISLERTTCYGRCPAYSVTLTSNGEATYVGKKYVERIGTYKAILDPAVFKKLVNQLEENNFFRLKESYETSATDLAITYTSVVRMGERKTVRNYGDGGPLNLHAVETSIDEAADKLDWKKDENAADDDDEE